MSHNVYLVLVQRFDPCHVLRHAVLVLLSLELESCKHAAWKHCGLCAVIFFVSAATSKKVKTKDSKQENIYSSLRHQSMKA